MIPVLGAGGFAVGHPTGMVRLLVVTTPIRMGMLQAGRQSARIAADEDRDSVDEDLDSGKYSGMVGEHSDHDGDGYVEGEFLDEDEDGESEYSDYDGDGYAEEEYLGENVDGEDSDYYGDGYDEGDDADAEQVPFCPACSIDLRVHYPAADLGVGSFCPECATVL